MGKHLRQEKFHIATVRTPMTRNLGVKFFDIKDEIETAFLDIIPPNDKGEDRIFVQNHGYFY